MKEDFFDVGIIGLGPAGLGAAIRLTHLEPSLRIVCFEAGIAANEKYCSIQQGKICRNVQPCQIISGIGGTSLLSGGKISLFPAGRGMAEILKSENEVEIALENALKLFSSYVEVIAPSVSETIIQKAKQEYRSKGFEFRYYDAYRYYKSNLVKGYMNVKKELEESKVDIKLNSEVYRLEKTNNGFKIFAKHKGNSAIFYARRILFAAGRFGLNLLASIDQTFKLESLADHIDFGIRLEFPTEIWPEIDMSHKDLKLHFGNSRTFCVNKGGIIAPYRLDDLFLVEGLSDPSFDTGLTNLAITVRFHIEETLKNAWDYFSNLRLFIKENTGGMPVRQRLTDYLVNKDPRIRKGDELPNQSSISYWRWGDINKCYPDWASKELKESVGFFVEKLIPKNDHGKIYIYAPELDYYWPKFKVNNHFMSTCDNLFLIGDSVGQFRGILQAFASGIKTADGIINNQ